MFRDERLKLLEDLGFEARDIERFEEGMLQGNELQIALVPPRLRQVVFQRHS